MLIRDTPLTFFMFERLFDNPENNYCRVINLILVLYVIGEDSQLATRIFGV